MHTDPSETRAPLRRALALVVASLMVACGEGGPTGPGEEPPVLAASVTVSPTQLRIRPGESEQLQAIVLDDTGTPISGRELAWTSHDTGIARVTSSGLVTAVAPGLAMISASVDGQSGAAAVTVQSPATTVSVTNLLIDSVAVELNGVPMGHVGPNRVRTFVLNATSSVSLDWTLARRTTDGGAPVGEAVSGLFDPVPVLGDSVSFLVDNQVGDTEYFAPVVSNETDSRLLMGVNMGLASESRCNCVVRERGTDVAFGYYRFFSNSNVRGYRDGSGYSGRYIYWDALADYLTEGSGVVRLRATSGPSGTLLPVSASFSVRPRSTAGYITGDRPRQE